jgi:hypothetical protein
MVKKEEVMEILKEMYGEKLHNLNSSPNIIFVIK